MYLFSNEEFTIMLEELLGRDRVCYDMLCYIAEKTLLPTVKNWCYNDLLLNGKEAVDDIMQEIYVRLIKTCVSHFVLRDGCDGPINNDPEGFKRWLFTVAHNIKRDFSNRHRSRGLNECGFEEETTTSTVDLFHDNAAITRERIFLLNQAFKIIIESDAKVYKVLTWVAQFLFILQLDVTKIKANELIIKSFEKKTLFEMRNMLMYASKKLVWLKVTEKQQQKIEYALQAQWDAGRVFGQVKYSELYMKKGAKATISDWVNRMNDLIKRVIGDEALNG